MYLKEWEPRVTGEKRTPRSKRLGNKHVGLYATLICPCCRHENEVSGVTSLEIRDDERTPYDITKECLELLAQRRDCRKCGTTSVMPAPDRAKVLEQSHSRVTFAWVREEIEKLTTTLIEQ